MKESCLETRGRDERNTELVRNDYNITEEYSAKHKDTISDGDKKGKGSNHGGHTSFLPDCSKPTTTIDYRNFDTNPESNIGDIYDIEGRNDVGGRKRAMAASLYNYQNQYGASLIDTSKNISDGQAVIKY